MNTNELSVKMGASFYLFVTHSNIGNCWLPIYSDYIEPAKLAASEPPLVVSDALRLRCRGHLLVTLIQLEKKCMAPSAVMSKSPYFDRVSYKPPKEKGSRGTAQSKYRRCEVSSKNINPH